MITYDFKEILNCNMCGVFLKGQKILGKRMNCSQGLRPSKKIGITTTVCQCKSCGLIYANPLPIPTIMAQHYGMPPEDYWNDSYFETDDTYFSHQIDRFFKLNVGNSSNVKGLDIGAGIGKAMLAMELRGISAFGLEPSEPFFNHAINSMGISTQRIQNSSIENALYSDNTFDFITFGAVLEHLYNPSESIRLALKWAKTGGIIHIEVPSANWLTNKISNLIYKAQGLDYVANISPMHNPFHLYEFTPKAFVKNGFKNNYDIIFSKFHICTTYLPKFLDTIIKPVMSSTNTGMQLEIWLRKL